MAETYHATATNVTFASNKSMLSLFYASGGTKVVRVYRVWLLNNSLTAVTGVLTTFELRLVSGRTAAGTAVPVVKHDSSNADLESTLYVETGASLTDTTNGLLRRIVWSNDEPSVSAASMDEWELLVPLNLVWDSGYGDNNVQPITLRPGSPTHAGFHVKHAGTTTVGAVDIDLEFTVSST